MGGGLKAVWQLEQDVSVAGGGATRWGNRESFIGLAGEFGTALAGRVANPFGDASKAIDPWDSNNNVASQLGIFKRHDGMPVSVRYDSPDFPVSAAAFNLFRVKTASPPIRLLLSRWKVIR